MKKKSLLATALLAFAAIAHAMPTEINYQGVLTDQNGNPVNGVRAMQIKIYDAPTGGTLLYSEDLGNVPVQDGIYSFSFGANGTSNALTTETVAIANGTVSTFQKVLAAPTVVAGSVTVTDGTYTWDQTNGSSNENDFSVAYSPNLRRITVTYYNGAPAAGKLITAKFRAAGIGITGAIGENNQPWIEVFLAGVAQTPRQKILSVPKALISETAAKLLQKTKIEMLPFDRFYSNIDSSSNYTPNKSTQFNLPKLSKTINFIEFSYTLTITSLNYSAPNPSEGVTINISLQKIDPLTNITTSEYSYTDKILSPSIGQISKLIKTGNLNLDFENFIYKWNVSITNAGSDNWGSRNSGSFNWARVNYLSDPF